LPAPPPLRFAATFGYDDLGRRTSIARLNGTVTGYGYDAASRLAWLTQDLNGTANDLTLTFAHNPAGQIVSRIASNDLYAWTGHGSGTTASAANGLNQLASQGGAAFGYDGRGNLASDPGSSPGQAARSFAYTAENQLASGWGHGLACDALGRLYHTG
jgi:uncharacterized protein RhaS with RHS repeats